MSQREQLTLFLMFSFVLLFLMFRNYLTMKNNLRSAPTYFPLDEFE